MRFPSLAVHSPFRLVYFDFFLVERQIHCAISEDLQQFYTALEWALMKFHKERMSVINNLVREMWHTTYKGKDIDFIEIKAEETSSVGKLSHWLIIQFESFRSLSLARSDIYLVLFKARITGASTTIASS